MSDEKVIYRLEEGNVPQRHSSALNVAESSDTAEQTWGDRLLQVDLRVNQPRRCIIQHSAAAGHLLRPAQPLFSCFTTSRSTAGAAGRIFQPRHVSVSVLSLGCLCRLDIYYLLRRRSRMSTGRDDGSSSPSTTTQTERARPTRHKNTQQFSNRDRSTLSACKSVFRATRLRHPLKHLSCLLV